MKFTYYMNNNYITLPPIKKYTDTLNGVMGFFNVC